jgi:pyruvate,water dikinase
VEIIRDLSKLDKDNANIAGGKGASLGEMIKAGISVPPGFVILASAFEKFLEETDLNVEIDSILDSVNHKEIHTIERASEKIKALILKAEMPRNITKEIQKFFQKLDSKYVAVRSSATAEDSASAAWAGQLESYLNTVEENLLENVKKCWASLFTPRAIFYRFEKDLHKQKISVAVVVQKMVESKKSGIAFSVHPITQDQNQLIIEAGFGLGEAIVLGHITPDSYVVEKQPRRVIDKNIHTQKSVLSEKEILELSELVLKIEKHFNFPCDIEWAFERDRIFIVQSRPITTLSNQPSNTRKFQTIFEDKELVYFGKRVTDQFWAKLRIRGWTEFLQNEIGVSYATIVINSNGEMFFSPKEDEAI